MFGIRAHIDLIWSRAKFHIMNIEIINKNNNPWLRYKRGEERWGDMIPQERGVQGGIIHGY